MEEVPVFEQGMRVLQTCALPLGYTSIYGADDGSRTRDLRLGKATLYQLSYVRIKKGRSMGIEPTSVGATIRCVNHFATTAILKL